MADGMPKPRKAQSTYDTIRNRGRDLDGMIEEASGDRPPPPKKAEPPKGMPKPSMMDRMKKLVGLGE